MIIYEDNIMRLRPTHNDIVVDFFKMSGKAAELFEMKDLQRITLGYILDYNKNKRRLRGILLRLNEAAIEFCIGPVCEELENASDNEIVSSAIKCYLRLAKRCAKRIESASNSGQI